MLLFSLILTFKMMRGRRASKNATMSLDSFRESGYLYQNLGEFYLVLNSSLDRVDKNQTCEQLADYDIRELNLEDYFHLS